MPSPVLVIPGQESIARDVGRRAEVIFEALGWTWGGDAFVPRRREITPFLMEMLDTFAGSTPSGWGPRSVRSGRFWLHELNGNSEPAITVAIELGSYTFGGRLLGGPENIDPSDAIERLHKIRAELRKHQNL